MKPLIDVIKNLHEFIILIMDDILLVAGLGFITKGATLYSEALGWGAAGLCCVVLAIIMAKRR